MLIYRSADGSIKIDVRMGEETVWLTQDQMAALFGKAKSTINEHLKNIFSEGELVADSVIRNFRTTAADGKSYDTNYYNLDVIISVGYRVKSHQGTQFRIWATQVLREYLIKGFALNDERMKSGKSMNYFDELQERIREIRLSERVFYQKVKDIYTTSIDYDPKAEKTVEFFKIVQNKLLWAISSQTAAELVARRADARLPMMGMTSCDKSNPRRITKADAATAKNYLTEDEMKDLGLLVEQYLAFAESHRIVSFRKIRLQKTAVSQLSTGRLGKILDKRRHHRQKKQAQGNVGKMLETDFVENCGKGKSDQTEAAENINDFSDVKQRGRDFARHGFENSPSGFALHAPEQIRKSVSRIKADKQRRQQQQQRYRHPIF